MLSKQVETEDVYDCPNNSGREHFREGKYHVLNAL